MAGAPAPVQPLPKLNGYDFLIAGAIFLGGGIALGSVAFLIKPELKVELPIWLSLSTSCAGGIATWAWLGFRAGSFVPRRQAVPSRQVVGMRTALRCYFLSLPGLLGITLLNIYLIKAISGVAPHQTVALGIEDLSPVNFIFAFIFIAGTQPWLEEVIFRGYFWRHLAGRDDFGPRRALLFSSLVFALAHEWQVFLPVFYLGLTFGWIYWRSGKLRYAIAIHAIHNACAVATLALPHDLLPN